jgi:hypothetical protein
MNNLTEHDRQQLTEAYQRAKERHHAMNQLAAEISCSMDNGFSEKRTK